MDTFHVDLALARREFDVEVHLDLASEIMAITGPSGSGKTSLLRTIAGLETPMRGRIATDRHVWFDSARGINLRPEERRVGMVFQDFALFPHMTVRGNLGFGGGGRTDDLLERLGLEDLADEHPASLSGGERQRVALGRALAADPDILLLDEPMAALDPGLRSSVRTELRGWLGDLNIPSVLVTHDFEDAAVLAKRIGVMVEGRIRQTGTPSELVAAPRDEFVATLTGANVIRGSSQVKGELSSIDIHQGHTVFSTDLVDGEVSVIVYPWDVTVSLLPTDDSTMNHIGAPIDSLVTLGNRARVRLGPIVAEITVASVERLGLVEGRGAVASFKATATRLVPSTSK